MKNYPRTWEYTTLKTVSITSQALFEVTETWIYLKEIVKLFQRSMQTLKTFKDDMESKKDFNFK